MPQEICTLLILLLYNPEFKLPFGRALVAVYRELAGGPAGGGGPFRAARRCAGGALPAAMLPPLRAGRPSASLTVPGSQAAPSMTPSLTSWTASPCSF